MEGHGGHVACNLRHKSRMAGARGTFGKKHTPQVPHGGRWRDMWHSARSPTADDFTCGSPSRRLRGTVGGHDGGLKMAIRMRRRPVRPAFGGCHDGKGDPWPHSVGTGTDDSTPTTETTDTPRPCPRHRNRPAGRRNHRLRGCRCPRRASSRGQPRGNPRRHLHPYQGPTPHPRPRPALPATASQKSRSSTKDGKAPRRRAGIGTPLPRPRAPWHPPPHPAVPHPHPQPRKGLPRHPQTT